MPDAISLAVIPAEEHLPATNILARGYVTVENVINAKYRIWLVAGVEKRRRRLDVEKGRKSSALLKDNLRGWVDLAAINPVKGVHLFSSI